MEVINVSDQAFRPYGKVLEGYDFTELFRALGETSVPEEGIMYLASVPELEACAVFEELRDRGFGGMPVQAGCCNGKNDTLNCLEYHKSSEFNIAKDDIVLLLGLEQEIEDGEYDTAKVKAFYVPAGTGVELYGTTLHYAPCGYRGGEYRVVCVLPRGTNEEKTSCGSKEDGGRVSCKAAGAEDKMCMAKNKWLLAHPESEEGKNGAYIGLTGENIKYSL